MDLETLTIRKTTKLELEKGQEVEKTPRLVSLMETTVLRQISEAHCLMAQF